jgi:mannose-6-phosphate isomerase
MTELLGKLETISFDKERTKASIIDEIKKLLETSGYEIAEENRDKPWGGYIRLDSKEADVFIEDFFPHLSLDQIKLGVGDAELSPKLLLVAPEQRLSLQYHLRRAEIWRFLNDGAYNKSAGDYAGEVIKAKKDSIVQFITQERHRLIGATANYTLVAEIWQHSDPKHISDEDDIIRLQDDYNR